MSGVVQFGCGLEHWSWPKVPKGKWGPQGWDWLQRLAIDYSAAPTIRDARVAYNRIVNFIDNLPCEECRYHTRCYFVQNPPALANTETLRSWVWRFHNAVNLRLGKPFYPYAAYMRDYADEIRLAAGAR